jgi:hypothetical protein
MFEAELKGVMAQAGVTEIADCPSLSCRMDRTEGFSCLKPNRSPENTGV